MSDRTKAIGIAHKKLATKLGGLMKPGTVIEGEAIRERDVFSLSCGTGYCFMEHFSDAWGESPVVGAWARTILDGKPFVTYFIDRNEVSDG